METGFAPNENLLIQGFAFRMFSRSGCPHCARVREFFASKVIPLQEVEVDKFMQQGFLKTLRRSVLELPITVCHLNGQLCIGFNEAAFNGWINLYRAYLGRDVANPLVERQSRFELATPKNNEQVVSEANKV